VRVEQRGQRTVRIGERLVVAGQLHGRGHTPKTRCPCPG
jgi:hypothetical protein